MRKIILNSIMAVLLCSSASIVLGADSAQLEKLQGKWEVSKTNDEGQRYKQVIEIAKDKLNFKIVGDDGNTYFEATGDVTVEQCGAIKAFTLTNLKAGQPGSLEDTDDERSVVYFREGSTLTLVTNMDKSRENEKPTVDVYRKAS